MHCSCVEALREYYGLERKPVIVHQCYEMLGYIDEDLKRAIGVDAESIIPRNAMFGFPNREWKLWQTPWGQEVLVPGSFRTTKNKDGDIFIYPQGDTSVPASGHMPNSSFFFDTIIRQEPIDETKLDPSDNLEEFGPISQDDLQYYKRNVKEASSRGRAVCISLPGTSIGSIGLVPAPFLKHPKGIRDITEWYISIAMRQDYLHQVFEKQVEFALANMKILHDAIGDKVDVVSLCGNDFGTQSSLFFSVDTFRELFKPYYKRLTRWIHQNTPWKIFKHSCGAIEPLMNEFIESGFDILNPVQCSASGMEPKHLQDTYGQHICFWGGGIDTQRILPFGTPEEVREQVLKRCEIFSQGGGYVFSSIHNVQAQTPTQNIVAMIDAVKEFNGKQHRSIHFN